MQTLGRLPLPRLLTLPPTGPPPDCASRLGVTTETLLSGPLKWVLPQGFYRPGMGLVAGFLVLFAVGLLLFLFTLVVNMISIRMVRKFREAY